MLLRVYGRFRGRLYEESWSAWRELSADNFLCPLGEVLRLDSGLARANFGPVPGGRLPAGGRYAARRELSKSVEFLKIGSLDRMLWL